MQYERGQCSECPTGVMRYIVNKTHKLCEEHNEGRLDKQKSGANNNVSYFSKQIITNKTIKTTSADAVWYASQIEQLKKHPFCQECELQFGKQCTQGYIQYPSRMNVSHILGKGAHTVLRNHLDNRNFLCTEHHQQWEFGNKRDMKIFPLNEPIVYKLLEYERAHSKSS